MLIRLIGGEWPKVLEEGTNNKNEKKYNYKIFFFLGPGGLAPLGPPLGFPMYRYNELRLKSLTSSNIRWKLENILIGLGHM